MKSRLLLAVCLLSAGALRAADTEAPVITSFSVAPAAVDITTGDATVQVTLHITDNDSGFKEGNIYLNNAAGTYVTYSFFTAADVQPGGDDKSGTYIVDVVIPQYGKAGTWTLDGVVADKSQPDNRRFYGAGNTPLPGPGNTVAVSNSGAQDIANPVIQSLALNPSTVDVTAHDQTISVTTRITDNPSGLRYGLALLIDGSSSDTGISHFFTPDDAAGTALDGTYTYNLTIPKGTAAGSYQLAHQLRDKVGNLALIYNRPDSYITVINDSVPSGGISDACDATQFEWTTEGDGLWFYQTAITRDGIDAARSGPVGDNRRSIMKTTVYGPGTLRFWWKTDCASGDFLSVETTGSGDTQSLGGQSAWTEVSLDIEAGEQTVTWVYAKNSSGSAGEDCGFVDRVRFEAEEDTDSPRIQYLNISPNPASVANGDVDVTLKFEISDEYSGFSYGNARIFDPDGNEMSASFDASDSLPGGDSLFGAYEIVFPISQADVDPDSGSYSLGGWHAEIEVNDNESHSTTYGGPGNDALPVPGTENFVVTDAPPSAPYGIESIDSIAPDSVDVSAGPGSVTVAFTLGDPDGIFDYGNIFLYRADNTYVQSYYFDGNDGADGHFAVPVGIPQYGQPGEWRVAFLLVDDNGGNTQVSGPVQSPGDDMFTVANTGAVDTTPAQVSSITIAPRSVDTSAGPANISVTAGISDDLSGLATIFVSFIDPGGSESGYEYVNGALISGGSFTINHTIPQNGDEGIWRCKISVRDQAGNYREYGSGGSETPFPVPADAEFTVGPVTGSSFASFAAAHSLTGNDALPGANPDHDWANNAMEFLLGLDPTAASAPDPAIYQTSRAGGGLRLDFKLAAGLTAASDGNFLNVANAAGDAPLLVTGQTATDLAGPWTDVLPTNAGGGIYRIVLPAGPGARGFCRLKFVDP